MTPPISVKPSSDKHLTEESFKRFVDSILKADQISSVAHCKEEEKAPTITSIIIKSGLGAKLETFKHGMIRIVLETGAHVEIGDVRVESSVLEEFTKIDAGCYYNDTDHNLEMFVMGSCFEKSE
ncbi:MAG: hypothetical protein RLZZ59_98 [Pseudomonadota bacterium]|jgi:hypothetical protein